MYKIACICYCIAFWNYQLYRPLCHLKTPKSQQFQSQDIWIPPTKFGQTILYHLVFFCLTKLWVAMAFLSTDPGQWVPLKKRALLWSPMDWKLRSSPNWPKKKVSSPSRSRDSFPIVEYMQLFLWRFFFGEGGCCSWVLLYLWLYWWWVWLCSLSWNSKTLGWHRITP